MTVIGAGTAGAGNAGAGNAGAGRAGLPVTALVVAGGLGTRLGGSLPKQFLTLRDRPVVQWALERLVAVEAVTEVILVLPASWLEEGAARLAGWRPAKPFRLVAGGARRQDSVAAGLAAVGHDGWVAVHDGARPALPVEVAAAAVAAALRLGNAVCAMPAADTLVEAVDGLVCGDVPRERVFQVQTPQVFPVAVLREALAAAARDGVTGTDDAGLVRRLGVPVHLVAGSPRNLKLTRAEDLPLLEALV